MRPLDMEEKLTIGLVTITVPPSLLLIWLFKDPDRPWWTWHDTWLYIFVALAGIACLLYKPKHWRGR